VRGTIAAGVALLAVGIAVLLAPSLVQSTSGAPGVVVAWSASYMDGGRAVVEEALTISPGFAVAYCTTLPKRATLTVAVKVLSGGSVNLWVMDRGEWENFKRGWPFHYYTGPSRGGIAEGAVSWVPPPGREVCLVVDNSFSVAAPKDARLRIEVGFGNVTPAGEYTQAYERDVGRLQPSRLAVLGAAFSITGLFMIAGGAASRTRPAGGTQKLGLGPAGRP